MISTTLCATAFDFLDSKHAAIGSKDGSLVVIEVEDGTRIAELEQEGSAIFAVAFGGWRLVSGRADGSMRVWDMRIQHSNKLEGHKDKILCISLDQTGTFAASASLDGSVKLWNLDEVRCVGSFSGSMTSVALTPNAEHLICKEANSGKIIIFNLKTGELSHGLDTCTNYSPVVATNNRIVSQGSDHKLKVWDLDSGRCLASCVLHGWHVKGLALTRNGHYIVSGSEPQFGDGKLNVYALESLELIAVFPTVGHIQSCATGPDGLLGYLDEAGHLFFLQLEGLDLADGTGGDPWRLGPGACEENFDSSNVVWRHDKTGLAFPAMFGEWRTSGEVHHYSPKDLGSSIDYYHITGVHATIYVYTNGLPMITISQESEIVQQELRKSREDILYLLPPDLRPVIESLNQESVECVNIGLKEYRFSVGNLPIGLNEGSLLETTCLAVWRNHLIKARLTMASMDKATSHQMLQDFLNGLALMMAKAP